MARRRHDTDSGSSEDEKRGIRHPRSGSSDEDKRKRRGTGRKSEIEGSDEQVRYERERRRDRNDDESRKKRRREERGNHGNRGQNMDRDSERVGRIRINGREDDESENNGHLSKKGDRDRERKSRDEELDNEDYRNGEIRRQRDYDEDGEKIGHKGKGTVRDSESDRRDRSRRSERGRYDDEVEREYRSRDDPHNKNDEREDNMKDRRRDRERERDRRPDENDEKTKRISKKDNTESGVRNMGLNRKGAGNESDAQKAQKQERNVGIDVVAKSGRSGGVYIPPFRLARMMRDIEDKSSVEYQRMTWEALKKSINGLVNKVNATNIKNIIPELFAENLIRGRGLFCRSCMKSQMASPGFTDVFAALVAVVNTKFPEVGDLLLRRTISQLQKSYKRNDKPILLAVVKFIAHLVNQQVVHELIALELLTLLLEKPSDDSVEVAVGFVTECGSLLQDLSPRALHGLYRIFVNFTFDAGQVNCV
ncbi:hypothetical protein OROGR_027512 [Orobanche gracilis]